MLPRRVPAALSIITLLTIVSSTACGAADGASPEPAASEPSASASSRPPRTTPIRSPAPVISDEDRQAQLDELTAYDPATPLAERVVQATVEVTGGVRV